MMTTLNSISRTNPSQSNPCPHALMRLMVTNARRDGLAGDADQSLNLLRDLCDVVRNALMGDAGDDSMRESLRIDAIDRLDRPGQTLAQQTKLVHESRLELGANHIRTAVLKLAMALAMFDAGKPHHARLLLASLPAMFIRAMGSNHPLVVVLGWVEKNSGRTIVA